MQLVGQAVREDVGQLEQRLGVERQRVGGQLRGVLAQLVERRQRAARQGRPAQLRLGRDRVEPGAGVVVARLRAVGVDGDRLVEGVGDHAVGDEVRGLGAGHVQHDAQDDAGEPDAADGRPEQGAVRVVRGAVRGEGEDASVRDQQLHRGDVVAERAGAVVVLAVHVAPDGAADGDLAGARAAPAPTGRTAGRRASAHRGSRRRRRRRSRRPGRCCGSCSAGSCRPRSRRRSGPRHRRNGRARARRCRASGGTGSRRCGRRPLPRPSRSGRRPAWTGPALWWRAVRPQPVRRVVLGGQVGFKGVAHRASDYSATRLPECGWTRD